MKRIVLWITAFLLLIGCAVPALAQEQRVYDYANLLNASDRDILEAKLQEASDEIGMDLIVLTSGDKGGKSSLPYAEDFYDEGNFGTGEARSGLVLFVDMEDRSVYLTTTGDAIHYYTDERIWKITDGDDALYDCLAEGQYRQAFEHLIDQLLMYYHQGIPVNQHNETGTIGPKKRVLTFLEILIALLIPGIVAFSYVNSIRKQYTMKTEKQMSAGNHLNAQTSAAFSYAESNDELIDHHVTRRIIPVVVSGGSGSSSGRSTIHMGSSGTFHGGGGGGRHF